MALGELWCTLAVTLSKPRVLPRCLDTHPLGRIELQQLGDQLEALTRQVGTVGQLVLSALYQPAEGAVCRGSEGQLAAQYGADAYAERPRVDEIAAVALARHHLE